MITVRVLVAVGRNLREIDEAFERIKSECDTRQHESLEKFKKAFVDYLWARCEFQTSVFITERWEWATSCFLDLAPDYHPMLRDLALKQKFMLSQYPIGPVAELVGIRVGVVSGVMNLESSGVEASDWRPRHEEIYHDA